MDSESPAMYIDVLVYSLSLQWTFPILISNN